MWNKLTTFVKPRINGDGDRTDHERLERPVTPDPLNSSTAANGSVMSRIYEQHPNLSMFHADSAVNLSTLSPSTSPSKSSKRSIFRRSLKTKLTSTPVNQVASAVGDGNLLSPASSVWTSPSPVKLIPKKIRASLQIDTFMAQEIDEEPTPGSDPLPTQPHTQTTTDQYGFSGLNAVTDPPLADAAGASSIRSILRDHNTPGTGQSVRFFSRDAYRVISPNVSEGEIDQEVVSGMDPEGFLDKLRKASPENSTNYEGDVSRYHSALMSPSDNIVDMFSPPRQGLSEKLRKPLPFEPRYPPRAQGTSMTSKSNCDSVSPSNSQSLSSLTIPVLPEDMPNLFDISQGNDMADVLVSAEGSLLENATEEVETDDGTKGKESSVTDVDTKTGQHNDEPAFPSVIPTPQPVRSSPGAVSDRTASASFSTLSVSHSKIDNKPVYFTPGSVASPVGHTLAPASGVSTTPSQDLSGNDAEDFIASIHGQLELQQQLAMQFEVDLAARDELVSLLSTKLQEAEAGAEKYRKEVERRQNAMRGLRQKVGELEKICRGLEEELERSREESFERSIMDEASEGALLALHGRIGQLNGELEKVQKEHDTLETRIETLVTEQGLWVEEEKKLRSEVESKLAAIQDLENNVSALTQTKLRDEEMLSRLRVDLDQKESTINEERARHHSAEVQFLEQKTSLASRLESYLTSEDIHDVELVELQTRIKERDEEVMMLKAEVEAQWGHAERADEKIKGLEGEKEALSKNVEELQTKFEELGADWRMTEAKMTELENDLNDAWAAKEDIEHERDQLIEDVNLERNDVERLARALEERGSKLDEVEQERRYATDNVARLEGLLRARDTEFAEAQAQIIEREREAEQLRSAMHKLKWEHDRLVQEQGRTVDETAQREEASRQQMEDLVKQKAEDQIAIGSMKERLGILTDETERLRRQVLELQQGSADKDIKLLQLAKARAQDKEDKDGLNIALDSKQQELELLKRKLGLKGTAGSTPAPNRIGPHDSTSRRQSIAFATPSAPRLRPGSSIGAAKTLPNADTPARSRLGTSVAGNGVNSVAPPPNVKSARPGSAVKRSSAGPLPASTSNLSRSMSSRPRSGLPVSTHRRSSSVMSSTSAILSEDGDKENDQPVKTARTSMIPA